MLDLIKNPYCFGIVGPKWVLCLKIGHLMRLDWSGKFVLTGMQMFDWNNYKITNVADSEIGREPGVFS